MSDKQEENKKGKVRAGLIPALKRGGLKNSERWLYETVKPGRDPVEALALAFSRLKSPELGKYFRENVQQSNVLNECVESALSGQKDQRLVLFFDQFEEVFTQVGHEEAREAFLNLLTHAATVEDGRVVILFAMRSDFVSNCATYPELNALLNKQFVQIGAMGPDELVSAIAQPALRVGLRIDPDLIAQIINDMQGEPGALPLMQFALKDLFEAEQAKGGAIALTREAYIQRGGIQKSLERHADASFAKLEKHEQELARSVFGGLIEIGRGTQDTRRTALFDELIPTSASVDEIEAIVRKLADARLITTDELAGKDMVTISHEKLIEAWPWLKKLVNENRDVIALQNQIATDAKEWEDRNRDKSYLYTGARLANAHEQSEAKRLILNGLAQEFVKASNARQRRGRVTLISAISITIIVLSVLSFFAIIQASNAQLNAFVAMTSQANTQLEALQRATAQANAEANAEEAQRQAVIAQAGELVAYSEQFRDSNFPLSLLLSIEAGQWAKTFRTRSNSLQTVQTNPQLLRYLFGHSDFVRSVAFSPDGRTLASGSQDGTIILWDVTTGEPLGQPLTGHSDFVSSVAFSPDGKTLASGGGGTIILWDVATGESIGQPLTGHSDFVSSVAFSPDGKTLVSGSRDKTIILWDMDPQSWLQKTCQRVGRNFTRAEWAQYFPNEKYRKTCEQWPLEPEIIATPTAIP